MLHIPYLIYQKIHTYKEFRYPKSLVKICAQKIQVIVEFFFVLQKQKVPHIWEKLIRLF